MVKDDAVNAVEASEHPQVPPDLATLAAAHGVATSYVDWAGVEREVTAAALSAVLTALDVPALDEHQVASSLAALARAGWTPGPEAVRVVLSGATSTVRWVAAQRPSPVVVLEDGSRLGAVAVRAGDQREGLTAWEVALPGLPLGHHRVVDGRHEAAVIAVPARLPQPPGRVWGWQVQLYAMRSEHSWGVGDYADLRTLASAAAADGAGVVLVNPLHAETPVLPLLDSPYSPSSRLFRSALHLRLEDCPEWDDALSSLRPPTDPDRVDRQACWAAKRAALQQMWPRHRANALAQFRADRGEPLEQFARFCALAEVHGRDHRTWPEPVGEP